MHTLLPTEVDISEDQNTNTVSQQNNATKTDFYGFFVIMKMKCIFNKTITVNRSTEFTQTV